MLKILFNLLPSACSISWIVRGLFTVLLCADTQPDSARFSLGIAKQCTRHEKILQFLTSRSSEAEGTVLDLSSISDLMGLEEFSFDARQQPSAPSLIYPTNEFYDQKPLLDFVGDMARSSKISIHPDGRVLFTGTGMEMNDFLSLLAEFYVSKNTARWTKQSLLIPYFDRYGCMYMVDSSTLQYECMLIFNGQHGLASSNCESCTFAPIYILVSLICFEGYDE